MRIRFSFIIIFLSLLSSLLIALAIAHTNKSAEPRVLEKDKLLQHNTFGSFVGVNSVRENRKSWIEDQYQVTPFHRVFGMDSYLFTGEEIVTGGKGAYFMVDPSIAHDEYPNDKIAFNPAKGGGSFDFDTFLKRMKNADIKTIPVLARNLLYTNIPQGNKINVWQIPYDEGGDPENPMDYKAYASFLYQFAARYGKNKLQSQGGTIKPQLLKLATNNKVKAGLDLIYAIEPGNEMDKRWFGDREYASPKILAAFLSAAIDGHMGMMGDGHGILTADSTMKILMPSPTDIKYGYVHEVLKELKKLRKNAVNKGFKTLPVHNLILTAHAYPFDENRVTEKSTIIENTSIFNRSYDFVRKLKNEYHCPIYLTEIGYDKVTGDKSPIGVPLNASDIRDTPEISSRAHAKHILRLLFTAYAAGYDKTFLFTLKDPVAIGGKNFRTKFSTTGLIRKNGKKDLAWFDVKFLGERLNTHHLTFAFLKQPINFLELENKDEIVLVYWLGTNSNKIDHFRIPKGWGLSKEMQLIDLSSRVDDGFKTKCLRHETDVLIQITEFPQVLIIPK